MLLPCLRPDMANLQPLNNGQVGRRYLTCCVRLSPEKEVERFLEVVEALQKLGAFERLQVWPCVCQNSIPRIPVASNLHGVRGIGGATRGFQGRQLCKLQGWLD